MNTALHALVLVLMLGAGVANGQSPATSARPAEANVAVPMRDGVALRADVYLPKGAGPFPTLVYRTPYGKDDVPKDYATVQAAVERGYAVVVEDVRGRYHSEGEF